MVVAVPGALGFGMSWLLSLYAFVSGASHLVLALHVRTLTKKPEPAAGLERRLRPERRLA